MKKKLIKSLFILFIRQIPKSRYCGVGAHQRRGKRRRSEKSEEKERDRCTEGKLHIPSRAIDAPIGNEEQSGKQKKEEKEGKKERAPNPATWTIWSPITIRMDDMVGIF